MIQYPNSIADPNVRVKLREMIDTLNDITSKLTASPPAGTFALAKITPGGENGSVTISAAGLVTAWTAPT